MGGDRPLISLSPLGLGMECTQAMKRLLQWFLHYGLMAAILVWAAAVGLMAYHLADSEWRWAFAALSVGGVATIAGILWIRTYIDRLTDTSQKGNES